LAKPHSENRADSLCTHLKKIRITLLVIHTTRAAAKVSKAGGANQKKIPTKRVSIQFSFHNPGDLFSRAEVSFEFFSWSGAYQVSEPIGIVVLKTKGDGVRVWIWIDGVVTMNTHTQPHRLLISAFHIQAQATEHFEFGGGSKN